MQYNQGGPRQVVCVITDGMIDVDERIICMFVFLQRFTAWKQMRVECFVFLACTR